MAMNRIPTLLIGLGGIGSAIAAGVNDLLSEEDKAYVGAIGVDTNSNDINIMKARGLQTIKISDDRKVHDYLSNYPHFREWFPVHPFLIERGMSTGAGQIRTLSRLAALAAEERNLFAPIESEINRIRAYRPDGNNKTLAVVVCGSITGGTGAGMFLQIPFYIRNLLKNTAGLENIIIRGLFFGPDITRPHQSSDTNRKAVGVNAYACLKELNAFYLTQMDSELKEKLKLDYYGNTTGTVNRVNWTIRTEQDAIDARVLETASAEIPYNYVYLIESNNANGGLGNVDVTTVENLASRILFTLLFTPVVNQSLSVEDNFTLDQIKRNGMNRYASAGLCSLVFPEEAAKEYVVLSTAKDLVQKEWTLIDKKCELIVSDAQSRQKSDGTVVVPSDAENYCDIFRIEVSGDNGTLGKLYSESFFKTEEHEEVTIGKRFFKKIEEQINAIIESDEVEEKKKSCNLDLKKMEKFENASTEVTRIENALIEYEKLAKNLVKTKSAYVANEVFPVSWESMGSRTESENCIFKWITKVHPVTARFLCYDVIRLLNQRIKTAQEELSGIDLSTYRNEDFDKSTAGRDSAMQVVQKLKEKSGTFTKLLSLDAGKIKKFAGVLSNAANNQSNNIEDWLRESLYINICTTLLKRFKALAENYKLFFSTLSSAIEANEKRLQNLENYTSPLGQIGVYCSSTAFRKMAMEYSNRNEQKIPDEVKTEIFKKIFGVVVGDLNASSGFETSEQQRRMKKEENKKVLSAIFNTAILEPLYTNVSKNGDGIVELTAKQALIKEFELVKGITAETTAMPEEFAKEAAAYASQKVNEAMVMAAPLLAIDEAAVKNRAQLVFLALHPDCAEQSAGKADVGLTLERYFPVVGESVDSQKPTILMNEEFSPNEIICLKTEYLLEVDDLIKYRPDSQNAEDYRERISNIDGVIADMFDEDAVKTVINPHLNRNWHEEGFIPELTEKERKLSLENKLKAFIYAMGLDLAFCIKDDDAFALRESEEVMVWHEITGGMAKPVKICGNRIGGRYIDFFNSLDYNRGMKKRILENAQSYFRKEKGYLSGEELFARVMSMDFVVDLIQPQSRVDEGDKNIYDILLSMRVYMKEEKYTHLFEGLIYAIWEFTSILFDRHANLVNKATVDILNAIYENSSVGKKVKEGKDLDAGEEKLRRIHETLIEQRYH
ncbi:MAG: hypothetical protein IJ262_02845 [Clostridia bacterium]|nr:hypothetical protein [Clostridia bacterium]